MSLTTTTGPEAAVPASGVLLPSPEQRHRFPRAAGWGSVLARDLHVTVHELPSFLSQVVVQPLFMLFVFGRLLTEIGLARPGYQDLLFPGIVAMTVLLTGLQGTALPLVLELGLGGEIEDRLLSPLPVWSVAVEKVVFAAARSLLAGAALFPLGWLVLGHVPFRSSQLPLLAAMVVLGGLAGASMGLCLGTVVSPQRINLAFALALSPVMFTGCVQYPWASLQDVTWFQWLTLVNPLTYVSEGLRSALLAPEGTDHLPTAVCVLVCAGLALLLTTLGARAFRRRVAR